MDTTSNPMAGVTVAIDGPAGTGKSSAAARVAAALGLPHVDTGAFYRAVTLAILRAEVDLGDEEACAALASSLHVRRVSGHTIMDGEDVEDEIRGDEVTGAVSTVAAMAAVRAAVTPWLREQAVRYGGVAEGRDVGSVIIPDADVKIFLTADAEIRAERRAAQTGQEIDEVLAEQSARDAADSGRDVAPLVMASDAHEIDTSDMELEDVVAAIVLHVRSQVRQAADPVLARRSLPRIAIVGRPNVGKSTLVNRILGRRVAIVEEKPGVTRDRTEHVASWLERPFVLVDTGGWEHMAEGMAARIVEQAEAAIASADLVLFVVDVTIGVLDDDERYAKVIRRSGKKAIVVANKVDTDRRSADVTDLYTLGLGDPEPISARHGRGVGDLLDRVLAALPDVPVALVDEDPVPRVTLIGKPNVGKSSLFNTLLGEERSIVDSVAHTTRDAVDTMVEIDGEPWVFVDTAGMRKKYRNGEDTEMYSVDRTRIAIESADLVLFLIDASEPIGEQDQRLAALLRDAGCGIIMVCNKWDLVDDERRLELDKELDRLLSFASFVPRVNISATTGRGVMRVLPQLREVWEQYTRRIGSGELNRWLGDATERTLPPIRSGKQARLRYVTQAETRPPVFVAFTNGDIPPAYRKYLERDLREKFGFAGVPLFIRDRVREDRFKRR
ncbi:MAG: GTP-binding protein [Nitriliruptoraceae bacterium]